MNLKDMDIDQLLAHFFACAKAPRRNDEAKATLRELNRAVADCAGIPLATWMQATRTQAEWETLVAWKREQHRLSLLSEVRELRRRLALVALALDSRTTYVRPGIPRLGAGAGPRARRADSR